ncbi:hypothetical protein TSUD_41870 [Trifolium subterraneum]|nr:hypothetical protein TSUD_41870 [Trifolium subterraneum]
MANEVEQFIFRELQSINDEYDETFTPSQVDTIVKFIATDYDDRRIQIRPDIAAQHVYDHVPRFVAYNYLNQLLEKLGQNSPLSIIENHAQSFSFLISELKGYFDGALWLAQLESFVIENEEFVKKVEATEEFVKEIFQDRLKSIENEKKKSLVELQVANALSNFPIELEEEMSDDALIEYLVYSDVIKCLFDCEMKEVQDMMRKVRLDMKPVLEFEAKHKLENLEFNIFSREEFICEKSPWSESMYDDFDWLEGTSKGIQSTVEGTTSKGTQSSLEGTSKGSQSFVDDRVGEVEYYSLDLSKYS